MLEDVFEREGVPKLIKTDNGPPFNGEEYRQYCAERGITPVFSTPLFPQQNGVVESYMKLINKAMISASINKTNYVEELREAVQAHNAAAHSVTKLPPEEVMSGRKIKRRLPLLNFEKVAIDDELLNKRDREAKMAGKTREDKRRSARQSRVKPGDSVIIERHTRGKGEARFSSKQYTVIEENNGSLTLNDEDGHVVKRHITQTKKVSEWRKPEAPKAVDNPQEHQSIQLRTSPRNIRVRKRPAYLQDFVQSVDREEHRGMYD